MNSERILITGGSGSLGTAIFLEAGYQKRQIVVPSHQEFDIADLSSARSYLSQNPVDLIINSAAITDWNKCHQDTLEAFRVNTLGAYNMALLAKENNLKMIQISTDAVFSGCYKAGGYDESDYPFHPTNVYGVTKLAGEQMAQIANPDLLITRVGWLFGPNPQKDKKFIGLIIKQVAEGNQLIKAVDDKSGSPAYAPHVVRKLFDLSDKEVTGIRHIANSGFATRFEIAEEVVKLWGKKVVVEAVSSEQFPSIVKRPDYSALSTLYEDSLLPPWQDALAEYWNAYPNAESFSNLKIAA